MELRSGHFGENPKTGGLDNSIFLTVRKFGVSNTVKQRRRYSLIIVVDESRIACRSTSHDPCVVTFSVSERDGRTSNVRSLCLFSSFVY